MKKQFKFIGRHLVLLLLAVIWLIPIVWLVVTSFSGYKGINTAHFFPQTWSLDNYVALFLRPDSVVQYKKWFANTLVIAIFTALISTIFVLMVAYTMSCMRFKGRKQLMSFGIILNMFPGVLSMIAVYYILKGMNLLSNPLVCLTLVYIAGAGLQYYIAKGFFDTIPKALDESAYLDGATKSQVFFKITLPLSKPIIVYTILTSFMAPWVDYIFPSIICGSEYDSYTVALGMFKMLEREFIGAYYTQFAAGAVLVSIPIAALFISMQKYYVEGVTGGAVKG